MTLGFAALLVLLVAPLLSALMPKAVVMRLPPAAEPLRAWAPIMPLAAAGLCVVAAWVLRFAPFDTIVGGWGPVSFTGASLLLDITPHTAFVAIALSMTALGDGLRAWRAQAGVSITSAIWFSGAIIAVFGGSIPAVLTGLAIMDIAAAWVAVRGASGERAMSGLALHVVALMLAGLAFGLASAEVGSALTSRLNAAEASAFRDTLFVISAALHAGLIPFDRLVSLQQRLQHRASILGAILLLVHAPVAAVPTWFLLMAGLTACVWVIRGGFDTSAPNVAGLSQAAGALTLIAAAAQEPAALAAAGAAWLLVIALFDTDRPGYLVASAVLLGLPGLLGFTALAGLADGLMQRNGLWVVPWVILLTAAQVLCLVWLLRVVAPHGLPAFIRELRQPSLRPAGWLWFGLLALHVVLAGLVPTLAGREGLPILLAGHGIAGWAQLFLVVVLTVAGLLLWRKLEPRWGEASPTLRRLDTAGLTAPLLGGLERIGSGLRRVFGFLESTSALLWACIVALLIVLINLSPTP
jgi:hypothetical protein